jgi:lambda family phage tail tape measure protein
VGDSIQGNDAAQKSFARIGVTLQDLQTLSQEDLFKKTIDGIAKLDSAAMRVKTQKDIFGKGASAVSFQGVSQDLPGTTSAAVGFQSAIAAGSDASENLKKQLGNLQQALLNVMEPLNQLAAASTTTVSAFENLIKMAVGLAGSFLVFGKLLPALASATTAMGAASMATGGALAWLGTQIMGVYAGLTAFVVNLGRAVGIGATAYGGFTSLGFALSGLLRAFLRFAGIAGIIYTVVEAVDFLGKKLLDFSIIDATIDKFVQLKNIALEYFNLGSGDGGGRGGNSDTTKAQIEHGRELAAQAAAESKARDEAIVKAKEFAERQSKIRLEIDKISTSMAFNNDQQLQTIALETRLIGKSEEQIELDKGRADIYKAMDSAIQGLLETRKQWAQGTEEQKASLGVIDAQIGRVKELTAVQVDNFTSYMGRLQGARTIERARLADLDNMTKAMEAQLKIQEALTGSKLSIISGGQDAAFQGSQVGQGTLQKQFMDIREANRKAGLEASRAFAAAFEDGGDGLTPERAQQLTDGLTLISKGYSDITDAQIANVEASRTWSAGWDEAFANYKDSAQNAAEQSKTYFDTFTKGVEDAMVTFVTTGKLSFSGLANSLIAEFARIQAKKMVAGLMDMGGGSGGGMSGVLGSVMNWGKSLLGFADGGSPPVGVPSIVGERGPELFVPRTAGTIIPNGAGAANNSVTNVTYNITATDAPSFQQLLARDPTFLHAVAEKGRRSLPQGAMR